MKRAIIMRGVPGAGKSTFIRKHFPEGFVVSADHFFEGVCLDCAGLGELIMMRHPHIPCKTCDSSGKRYTFERQKLGEAHGACLRAFVEALLRSAPLVVVDNTNITGVEIAPYAQLTLAYGYELEVLTLDEDPEVAYKRNVHGVPLKTCERGWSRLRLEAIHFPKHWNHKTLTTQEAK